MSTVVLHHSLLALQDDSPATALREAIFHRRFLFAMQLTFITLAIVLFKGPAH